MEPARPGPSAPATTIPAHSNLADEDPFTNTVSVEGVDRDGDEVIGGSDEHAINILHTEGEFTILKSGAGRRPIHGDRSTTIRRHLHAGADDPTARTSSSVTTTDWAALRRCDVSGDTDDDGGCEADETWTSAPATDIPAHSNLADEDPFTNTVSVEGEDRDGDEVIGGSDEHAIDILHTEGEFTILKSGAGRRLSRRHGGLQYDVTYMRRGRVRRLDHVVV